MKKLCIALSLLLVLSGCGGQQPESAQTPSEIDGADAGIPQETLADIQGKLIDFFPGYDDVSVYVSDNDGALKIFMQANGMVMQVTFPDYANALVVQSQELAAEYGLSVSEVSITFTAGEDNLVNWCTSDCISGTLLDSYNGKKLFLINQTISDLVDRYGAMNWFYPLN